MSFLMAELGTIGSVDGNNQLIIKGVFQQKNVESVLKKYISEYTVSSFWLVALWLQFLVGSVVVAVSGW